MANISFTELGFALVIFGFFLAFVAVVVWAVKAGRRDGSSRSAGLIMIGPIPIVFGSDKSSVKVLMILAVVLIVIFLVFMLLPTFLLNR